MALLSLLLLAATAISLASCNKDDDPKESDNNNVNPDNHSGQNSADTLVRYYNDLEFFQDYFVATDSVGNFLYRSMGVPLYESDTAHLYIGVDNLDEALRYFEYAIAPDIAKQTSVSNNYIYTLTDTSGNSQGTVSFVPGSGTSVAEVTTDLPDLMYFNKVTFLQNSAWPHNSAEKVWHKGDIRIFTFEGNIKPVLKANDKYLKWVLLREAGNGVTPLWGTITHSKYSIANCGTQSFKYIIYSMYCPTEPQANNISRDLNADWDFFVGKFNEAGCGGLTRDELYYCFNVSLVGGYVPPFGYTTLPVYRLMCYGNVDATKWGLGYEQYPVLLTISWLEDNTRGFYSWLNVQYDQSGESAANLFDDNPQTKWCSDKDKKIKSDISGEKCWLVEFMSEKPINPTAYYMVTGNDTEKFTGRNPKKWNMYAKKNPGDPWLLIDKRDNTDSYVERMENKNFWKGWWGVSVGKEQYQYFRLEMYENWGDNCFQISEIGFQYNENAVNNDNELSYSVIDASYGEPGNLAPCLFDGNLDTKWCVYKGNKSGTPLHDGKCWYVEFKASKPITPAGFYMTTASDHTVFPDRAPRIWNLYGLKDGWWTLIASYDNTDTPMYQMTNLDQWTGYWAINVAKGEYQDFRLEMYENWGGDCFQISEFGFYF